MCGEFERAEFEVNDARYEGKHFGSWYIELERKGIRSRQISLDGRDGLLIVQIQNADGEWIDDWHTLIPEEQSFEKIVARLT